MSRRPPAPRLRAALAAALAMTLGCTLGLVAAASASAAVDTGAWYVLVNRQSGKALDVAAKSTADGAALQQWTRNDGANQQWQLVDSGSGYYRLKARHSGKVVDLWNWSTADRGEFRQYTDLNGTNQQFRLVESGGGAYQRLVNRHSGKVLTVTDRSTADGASVTQLTDNNQYNQQWELVRVGSSSTTPTTPPTTPAPTTPPPTGSWPTATGQQRVTSTIKVSGTFDGGLVRYYGLSSGGQDEGQPPVFELADGATIRNVILGTGAADGIHCRGTCTVQNVWWEDVGEDAATFKGTSSSQTMTVDGGGARYAADKVFQHNGPGTFVIKNFQVQDFGKLYRSCGNCSTQHARSVQISNVTVTAPAKSVVGINPNLGDRASISGLTIVNDPSRRIVVCEEYRGVTSGEPTKVGSGPSSACGYDPARITYR